MEYHRKKSGKFRLPFSRTNLQYEGVFGQSKDIELDKIGEVGTLLCPDKDINGEALSLTFEIETQGSTKMLTIVTGNFVSQHQEGKFDEINKRDIEMRRDRLAEIESSIGKQENIQEKLLDAQDENDEGKIEYDVKNIEDFSIEGPIITSTNKVLLEVLECRGLHAADLSGLSNPYCEIELSSRSKRKSLLMRTEKYKTYSVEKTLAPVWHGQSFVLDIPEDAVESTRNCKSFIMGQLLMKSSI